MRSLPAAAAPLLNHSGPSPWLPGLHGNASHHGQVAAELLVWGQGMHGPALVTSPSGAVLGRNGWRPPL